MAHQNPTPAFATLNDWIEREAIPFSLDDPASFHAAVQAMAAVGGDTVELLGFGEALHGGEDILVLRNRLFQRLVEAHGFRAVAVESSFPRGRLVDDYVAGRGPSSYREVQEAGFSHGFGTLEANRDLVEWMRQYNTDPPHGVSLRFYGFDSPTEMMYADSPRRLLHFVLDVLDSADPAGAQAHRERIDALLGEDAAWENPAVAMDPSQGVGLSPEASALRLETEEVVTDLQVNRPEVAAKIGEHRYREALHAAAAARMLLTYHAAMARPAENRIDRLLGIRDAMMAENLAYVVSRERQRGKVLAFAHNSHLQRGRAGMQLGPNACAWWPAGAHLAGMFGPRYAVIGTAVAASEAHGLGQPEPGTLEARLMAAPGPARFIPTHLGERLPASDVASLATRTGSAKNPTYFALTPRSVCDFDGLAVLDATG